jgi:hypothetical protein
VEKGDFEVNNMKEIKHCYKMPIFGALKLFNKTKWLKFSLAL